MRKDLKSGSRCKLVCFGFLKPSFESELLQEG
jgi:hypothetical protein